MTDSAQHQAEFDQVVIERPMTDAERAKWHIGEDQCPWLMTTHLPLDTACLMPRPCDQHSAFSTGHEPGEACYPRVEVCWDHGTAEKRWCRECFEFHALTGPHVGTPPASTGGDHRG